MSLTLRSAALFYRGATENIGYGDIVPPLDGVEATGHSTIIGNGNLGTAQEVVYGTGDSHLADGRINDILHEISGAGLSEYGIFGDITLSPRRDIVHLDGAVPFSLGNISQSQEISGGGTSGWIAGVGRIKPNKCGVSSSGNSDYVACKGPLVYIPPLDRIQGLGYPGTFTGVGNVINRRHAITGTGTSLWTLVVTGSGSISPNTDTLDGIGTSDHISGLNGAGLMTGHRHDVSGNGFFLVAGAVSITQNSTINAKGNVGSNRGTLEFSRDHVAIASTQPTAGVPLEHNRPGVTAAGGQSPIIGNQELLEFSR